MTQIVTSATLVYQAGIANVFECSIDGTTRLLQSDFRACEYFCRGLKAANVPVNVAWCNMAGDVTLLKDQWRFENYQEAPFFSEWRPPIELRE